MRKSKKKTRFALDRVGTVLSACNFRTDSGARLPTFNYGKPFAKYDVTRFESTKDEFFRVQTRGAHPPNKMLARSSGTLGELLSSRLGFLLSSANKLLIIFRKTSPGQLVGKWGSKIPRASNFTGTYVKHTIGTRDKKKMSSSMKRGKCFARRFYMRSYLWMTLEARSSYRFDLV